MRSLPDSFKRPQTDVPLPLRSGLYCNSLYGNQWFLLLGAALCGISAGTFWVSAEVFQRETSY